jgi:hypothetical protein
MPTLEIARAMERLIIVACAPLLLYVGYRLLVLGITGQIQLSANIKNEVGAKFTNLSPGGLCFVLAVAIGIASFSHPLTWTKEGKTEHISASEVPAHPAAATLSYLGGPERTQFALSIEAADRAKNFR